jgi:FAD/FMN-containing dehydrogenase/FMN-dependent NADH-azoreductase
MVNVNSSYDRLKGKILTPRHKDFEAARALFNGAIDIRPALIAQCSSVDDVRAALALARAEHLPIAVRSGGHSPSGTSLVPGGLVIDLRRMNHVRVDPELRTAVVGGGALWSEFDRAAQPFGLATTGGRISSTGVGGLTLGGGSGWLERKFGLACDNVIEMKLVTAAGELLTVSEKENADLLWALRGGGGNFGIVTEFTFRLHAVPSMTVGILIYPPDRGERVARRYRDFMHEAPDEVGGQFTFMITPPAPFVPPHLVGTQVCAAIVTYIGGQRKATRLMAPLIDLRPQVRVIMELPYADLQCMVDEPPGARNYPTVEHLNDLSDAAVKAYCSRAADLPFRSQYHLIPWGGAVARGASGSPLSTRDAAWLVHPLAVWDSPADDDHAITWVRDVQATMRPWGTGGAYLNFVGDEGEQRVVAAFGEANYAQLAALKAACDPDNVFNRWHNIRPRAAGATAAQDAHTRLTDLRVRWRARTAVPHLLHIDSSARGADSLTRQLSACYVAAWKTRHPEGTVTYRDLATITPDPVSADWITGVFAPAEYHTRASKAAVDAAETLIREVEAADVLALGVPMYNLSVPASFKAWIDQIIMVGRTCTIDADGRPLGLLAGKKAVVLRASGSDYANPMFTPYDFHQPYLRTVLGLVGITDIEFIAANREEIETTMRAAQTAIVNSLKPDGPPSSYSTGGDGGYGAALTAVL